MSQHVDRFTGRVADYARHRPGYPRSLLTLLRARAGLSAGWVIADIGSGTGLSAQPFLEAGHAVIGVEPNREMREAAEAGLIRWPGFTSVPGRAEATGLPDGCVDLVVAGQAFHWFDADRAAREFARILRPPARVALFWNTRRTDGTPFLIACEELLQRHGTDYARVRHDRVGEAGVGAFFDRHERHVLPNAQVLDREGLRGRILSSPYTPPAGDPARVRMIADLDEVFRAHESGGVVRIEYDLEVWIGQLPGPAPQEEDEPCS